MERAGDTIKVGTRLRGYRERRNITSLPLPGVDFRETKEPARTYWRLRRALGIADKDTQFSKGLFVDTALDRVDMFHFFFTLGLTPRPWVVTFSHFVPRWNASSPLGQRLLLGRNCHRLIAISDFARRRQEHFLRLHSPDPEAAIAKLVVLHPAQPPLLENVEAKRPQGEQIVFTFVGHEFFRKGGLELLRAVARAKDLRLPLVVNIVSQLRAGDYASRASKEELTEAHALLDRLQGVVRYLPQLPNADVLELFRRSDVGLLPTYDDLYGYSVLEAQAAGCPVITTSTNSLLEINGPETGWIIEVPTNEFGIANRHTAEDRRRLSDLITEGLFSAIRQIVDNPSAVRVRGGRAFDRIRRFHNPADRAADLLAIYARALGR